MGLEYKTDGRIAIFTLNNPGSQNALDIASLKQFETAMQDFNANSDLRAGIIQGAGDKSFCSGIDLKETLTFDIAPSLPLTLMRGLETHKPLIAAVNGSALGGGLELLLCCDIRLAVPEALFGFPEVKIGLIPGWGGTQRIIRELTRVQAAALLFTGRSLDAAEALRTGLINQICPANLLMSNVREWADIICQAAPLAVQAAKEAMAQGSQVILNEGLQIEDALCAYLKTTRDFQEGIQAFREKRPPRFWGH
jgi:enoyl-CoA hydratase/carnithine racemase